MSSCEASPERLRSLNIPPNQTGLVAPQHLDAITGFGAARNASFGAIFGDHFGDPFWSEKLKKCVFENLAVLDKTLGVSVNKTLGIEISVLNDQLKEVIIDLIFLKMLFTIVKN